jgi:hypothetical protein
MAALGQRLFDNEEVVAARMRFDEGNHDGSIVPQPSTRHFTSMTSVVQGLVVRTCRCERTVGR